MTSVVFFVFHLSCTASEETPGAAAASTPTPTPTPAATSDNGSDTGDPSTSAATLRIESMGRVIGVTDPVAPFPPGTTSTSATAASNFDQLVLTTGLRLTATNGVSLGETTSKINDAFVAASGSKIFCDTVNNGMKFFRQAAVPDSNLCILKASSKKYPIKPSGYQIWDFKVSSFNGTGTYRMKFLLETNADEGLKKFELFNCEAQGTASLSQTGYSLQTVTDNKIAIHTRSRDAGGDGRDPGFVRTDVLSEINSSGRLVGLKNIDFVDKTGDRTVHTKVIQSATNVQAIGYEYVSGRETKYLSFTELIDSNAPTGQYYVTKIAYGDGAALTKVTDGGGSPTTYTRAWDGDTLKTDNTKPRLAKVQNRDSEMLTASGDTLDMDFSAAETYACTGNADVTITWQVGGTEDSCRDAYEIDQNGRDLCTTLSY